ncbi:MAG: DUF4982 domain-containing protein [Anaerolineae bacterium]|nr:DUF4982 domain-containing protein [Anaerolineae bacterium]
MQKLNFNQGWTFYNDGREADAISVDLPHDAMIHEVRDPESPGGNAVGYFPGGVYVYEKIFAVPEAWQDKHTVFEFEGIYRHSKVYLNGQEAGGRPYGYTRFFVEADAFLEIGKENTLRVVVDNSQLPNSRWYSGSGIYRPVHLLVGNKTHIAPDGVKVSILSYAPAKILVETAANGGEIGIEILDGDTVVATGSGAAVELGIEEARLWSAETPNLYRCRVTLRENGRVLDEVTEAFGIRTVAWFNQGLFINGKETLLRGGCIHHDNGILGACAYDQAEARRVRILKEAGFNAIRSAHNPTSQALLAACDRYGMYVMDEFADMWTMHKTKYDYASDFDDWYLADLKAMVDQDFNHPSVIMYSIGNEVSEPYEERGVQLAREMVDYLHRLDRNRAVTAGINSFLIFMASKGMGIFKEEGPSSDTKPKKERKQQASGSLFFNTLISIVGPVMSRISSSRAADRIASPCLDALDIAGYNYGAGRYARDRKQHPDRVVCGSETFHHNLAKNWDLVKKYPHVIGDFMWTGWDYLGEASIGAWAYDGSGMHKPYPWLISECGAIDILGNPGAPAAYAAAVWGLGKEPYIGVRPANHPGERVSKGLWRGTNAVDSWAWKGCDGNRAEIDVFVDAHEVEVFINGTSLGRKKIKAFKALYRTTYAPGTVRAVAYDQGGAKLSESELVSATGQTRITLKPEETTVKAGDLVYVNVHLVGENGVVESNDDRTLSVTVDGGELLGFGNANPCTEERFDSGSTTTYYGKALAVVCVGPDARTLQMTVSSEGCDPQVLRIPIA